MLNPEQEAQGPYTPTHNASVVMDRTALGGEDYDQRPAAAAASDHDPNAMMMMRMAMQQQQLQQQQQPPMVSSNTSSSSYGPGSKFLNPQTGTSSSLSSLGGIDGGESHPPKGGNSSPRNSTDTLSRFRGQFTHWIDYSTLYPKTRWSTLAALLLLLALRIYYAQGYYVVPYVLGIYLLNILIGVLTPQLDPLTDKYILPVAEPGEYRPFLRKLPEAKAWYLATRAVCLSLIASVIPILDLPVYAPILVVYFLFLLFMTLRQQVKEMIKHRYVPFSWGKKKYGDVGHGTVHK